jgi:predicted dehydrogenase
MADQPQRVSAVGGRNVFTARPECAGRRCLHCPEKLTCPEYCDIEGNEITNELYRKAEDADGYILDCCAFGPEADIYDNALVQIEFAGGKRASYALSLFYEKVGIEREFVILGTEGRLDVSRRREEIILHRRRTEDVIHYKLQGHGEGFELEMGDFLDMVETGKKPVADSAAGYWCALEGLAAEKAIEDGRTVAIAELL